MMKQKCLLVLTGALSLILFGLIFAQPVQALFLLVDWPGSRWLQTYPVVLCILVGLIQGICEEVGYYSVFRCYLKGENTWQTPFYFGIGRAGLELIYNSIFIVMLGGSIWHMFLLISVRLSVGIGTMGMTYMDYLAAKVKGAKWVCGLAVLLHMIVNGSLYAIELGLVKAAPYSESFVLVAGAFIMIVLSMVTTQLYGRRILAQ